MELGRVTKNQLNGVHIQMYVTMDDSYCMHVDAKDNNSASAKYSNQCNV